MASFARASQCRGREAEERITHEERQRAAGGVHRGIVSDPKQAAAMFTEDGAFEMPYLESFGLPGRYEGREAIAGFFRFVRDLYPDMDLEHINVLIDTPAQAFAEYEFTAQSSKTGRTIHELFFGRLVAENGQIKLLRESINLVELALGLFPNGLADQTGTGRVLCREALAPSTTHEHCR